MASDGDVITYSYSGSKVTEDISDITTITIDRMDGADGSKNGDNSHSGGSGGYISGAEASVADYSTLEIWVGSVNEFTTSGPNGGFGRSDGGDSGITGGDYAGGGGGSTELWTNNNSTFIAAADGGGGAAFYTSGTFGTSAGGGGGGAGGVGGTGPDGDGNDGESLDCGGKRTACAGGDGGSGSDGDGADGGQELGIASGGTNTTGGSNDGNGEIKLSFKQLDRPEFDQPLELDEKRNGRIPSVSYSKTADKLRIYRATGDDPPFPVDYTQIDEESGTSFSDYTDTGSPYDADVHYAVAPVEGGSEKLVQGFSAIYIPPKDSARIGDN